MWRIFTNLWLCGEMHGGFVGNMWSTRICGGFMGRCGGFVVEMHGGFVKRCGAWLVGRCGGFVGRCSVRVYLQIFRS